MISFNIVSRLKPTTSFRKRSSINMATPKYNAEFISAILKRSLYASFNTLNGDKINSRIMVFASDPDLKNFYCLTNKTSEKIAQLGRNPFANLLILGTSDKLDGNSETQVQGTVQLFTKFTDKEVKTALDMLSEKSSMMSTVKDSGSLGDFCIISVRTAEITFRVFKDILQNIPKTTLKF